MTKQITHLNPTALWKIFHDLTRIPRPSKKEAKAAEYVYEFGKKLGLETYKDSIGNVIIRKPATRGKEDHPGVILQAHVDMVPQKNSDKEHDFEKDPINAVVDGEWVRAEGTTLGSDNGIGVAAALAVMESDEIEHGPVEALLTVDEETGMTGAFQLEPGKLQGKILINLDSEDEGELYIGCAGGMDAVGVFEYKEEDVPGDVIAYQLGLTGLKGGHSGLDIHLGRGNSNKLLNRFMWNASREFGMRLASIEGGSLRNAIPRESFAVVTVPGDREKAFLDSLDQYLKDYKREIGSVEPGLQFRAEPADMPPFLVDKNTREKLFNAIYGIPSDVIRMSAEMPGVVETSTNLAIVRSGEKKIEVLCLMRGAVDSAKKSLGEAIQSVLELAGAEVTFEGEYPGWKPDPVSGILNLMKEVYKDNFGKVPEIKVIHAGLECGIIGDTYPGLDMISFGPTIRYPHSPDEKVNIETVEKFWEFLVKTLERV